MKQLIHAIIVVVAIVIYGCNKSGISDIEKAEGVAAEELALQMADPVIAGRNAARTLVSKEWKDTLQLQKAILEVKSKQSFYLQNGERSKAEKFDSAFIATLRTVRPDLAAQLSPRK